MWSVYSRVVIYCRPKTAAALECVDPIKIHADDIKLLVTVVSAVNKVK